MKILSPNPFDILSTSFGFEKRNVKPELLLFRFRISDEWLNYALVFEGKFDTFHYNIYDLNDIDGVEKYFKGDRKKIKELEKKLKSKSPFTFCYLFDTVTENIEFFEEMKNFIPYLLYHLTLKFDVKVKELKEFKGHRVCEYCGNQYLLKMEQRKNEIFTEYIESLTSSKKNIFYYEGKTESVVACPYCSKILERTSHIYFDSKEKTLYVRNVSIRGIFNYFLFMRFKPKNSYLGDYFITDSERGILRFWEKMRKFKKNETYLPTFLF